MNPECCRYCHKHDAALLASAEFNCLVHEACLINALKVDPKNREALIMVRELAVRSAEPTLVVPDIAITDDGVAPGQIVGMTNTFTHASTSEVSVKGILKAMEEFRKKFMDMKARFPHDCLVLTASQWHDLRSRPEFAGDVPSQVAADRLMGMPVFVEATEQAVAARCADLLSQGKSPAIISNLRR